MKRYLLTFLLLLCCSFLFARQIGQNTASKVAGTFYSTVSKKFNKNNTLTLTSTMLSATDGKSVCYYIFNSASGGFVIIAGDDRVKPVLAYSTEGSWNAKSVPSSISEWLQNYQNQIAYAIDKDLPADKKINGQWQQYEQGQQTYDQTALVSPLVSSSWNQSPYYNDLCPYDKTYKELTVTGCVATAMSQIMRYWQYPAAGVGYHSYSTNSYGTLSANFEATNYDWKNMPAGIVSQNTGIATLMYQCGVAVEMSYGVSSTGGSSSYVISSGSPNKYCAEYAFKTFFDYDASIKGAIRSNYTSSNWLSLLKAELDNNRPLMYAGFGSSGGHAFVLDGYDNQDYFHCNWGWGGYANGYFSIDAMNPSTYDFNSSQQALIGIRPNANIVPKPEIDLNSNITISKSPVRYNDSFTVFFDVINNGNADFSGDYAAVAYDENNNFIDTINRYFTGGFPLPAGYHYTSPGLIFHKYAVALLPGGNYHILVLVRPFPGGQWSLAGESLFKNRLDFTVANTMPIQLNSAISVKDSAVYRAVPFSVSLTLKNNMASTYNGQLELAVHHLDGSYVDTVHWMKSISIPAGGVTSTLTFSSKGMNIPLGTYMFVLWYWDAPANKWQLTGSSTPYFNPLRVDVTEQPLNPDKYEKNDSLPIAYNLTPYDSLNGTLLINTKDCNFHTGKDFDYYKVICTTGSNKLRGRLQDINNSSDGNAYTTAAYLAYYYKGQKTIVNANDSFRISVAAGDTVYFSMAPYFQGQTGTYLLDLRLTGAVGKLPNASFKAQHGAGRSYTFTANTTGLASYAWDYGDGNVGSGAVATHTYAQDNTYTVKLTVKNIYGVANSSTMSLTVKSNGIALLASEKPFTLFPNPVRNELNILFNGNPGPYTVRIYNLSGQCLSTQTESNFISTSSLKPGTYFLELQTKEGVWREKFVKE